MRVKYAYLRMNADALQERLVSHRVHSDGVRSRSLRQRIERIHSIVTVAPPDISKQWVMPTVVCGKIDSDDPNSLCVPQDEDYYDFVCTGSTPTVSRGTGGDTAGVRAASDAARRYRVDATIPATKWGVSVPIRFRIRLNTATQPR